MELQEFERVVNAKEGYASLAFPKLMRKVYVWMTLALLITGITAYGVAISPSLALTIFQTPVLFWGLIIGEFALVMGISAFISRLSLTTATLLFILYSVVNGATLSCIFFAYPTAVIAKVFFITSATFAVTAIAGYTTRRDLSRMGGIAFMGLVGIIVATLVNLFLHGSGLDLIISYIGVAVFVGLTAWDSQRIKMMRAQAPDAGEQMQKMALLGALELYLDFINLFLYLLRIFGRND